jgi:hypothetical protein
MPASTNPKNLPYPLGTDRVMDGDDAIRALAQSVDNMVQAGSVQIAAVVVDTTYTINVAFPVAYAAAPIVMVTPATGAPAPGGGGGGQSAWVQAITTAGCTVGFRRTGGGGTSPTVIGWLAVGPVAAIVATSLPGADALPADDSTDGAAETLPDGTTDPETVDVPGDPATA